ncbi:MAG: hypothetical protein DBP02_02420 [gamma proteobacterium symbiont of Ctena orbiculata]|nr:MAG: hypothetical protein DBP01_18375 [gamma proteobacterium symbiont of Ctena orbiculata]PUB86740.1 MAG: hypothetical protein DBP02_02420 [gamma proteobacterium symbiont of Ctena orbiculata]
MRHSSRFTQILMKMTAATGKGESTALPYGESLYTENSTVRNERVMRSGSTRSSRVCTATYISRIESIRSSLAWKDRR